MRTMAVGFFLCLATGVIGCAETGLCESDSDCGGRFDQCERACDDTDPGMCTKGCNTDLDCPSDYTCITSGGRCLGYVCIKECESDSDCPADMSCFDFGFHTYCGVTEWDMD
jgi:hypothetical protein